MVSREMLGVVEEKTSAPFHGILISRPQGGTENFSSADSGF
jgi:hypothetical protein